MPKYSLTADVTQAQLFDRSFPVGPARILINPVILPTEEKVAEMLKGTSHHPDEALGKLAPTFGNAFEYWTFTVKDLAVNAVMAGCKPEYFPVILAVASTNKEGISVSDNSFVEGLVINGAFSSMMGFLWVGISS